MLKSKWINFKRLSKKREKHDFLELMALQIEFQIRKILFHVLQMDEWPTSNHGVFQRSTDFSWESLWALYSCKYLACGQWPTNLPTQKMDKMVNFLFSVYNLWLIHLQMEPALPRIEDSLDLAEAVRVMAATEEGNYYYFWEVYWTILNKSFISTDHQDRHEDLWEE